MDMKRQLGSLILEFSYKQHSKYGTSQVAVNVTLQKDLLADILTNILFSRQHFPTFGLTKMDDLVDVLNAVSNQTCDCSIHAALPMHGPSKYIKAPIPSYSSLQELHLQPLPGLHQGQS